MNNLQVFADSFGRERIQFNESLSYHTALGLTATADAFFIATSKKELVEAIKLARSLKIPFTLIGTGSKVVLPNERFQGLVIRNATKNIKIVSIKGKIGRGGIGVDYAHVEADSGLGIKKLVDFLDKQGLISLGFEDMPGSLGGNLFSSHFLQGKTESTEVLNEYSEITKKSINNLGIKKDIILSAVLKIKALG